MNRRRFTTNRLWLIVTSNNRGSFDETATIYTDEAMAQREASSLNAKKRSGRADYLVTTLEKAISERIDEAISNAMTED